MSIASKAGLETGAKSKNCYVHLCTYAHKIALFSMTAYEGFFMALVGKWPR
jgi:hypothetical protein